MLNDKFILGKCVVEQKEIIMRNSYGEISGFTAVGAEELLLVNGGKGGSGGSSKSSNTVKTKQANYDYNTGKNAGKNTPNVNDYKEGVTKTGGTTIGDTHIPSGIAIRSGNVLIKAEATGVKPLSGKVSVTINL
jgi:hypothetical protein